MRTKAQLINPDHLPPRAQEIAEYIGLPALLQLVEWRGGVSLYVPKTPTINQPLTQQIGITAARQLAEIYGGENLEIPKCDQAARAALHASISRRRENGESETSVALDTGLTGRWVRVIHSRHRQQKDDRQEELF